MLVLARRLKEKLVFPGIQTNIQVVALKPGLVRLGIEAPPDVLVCREEVMRSSLTPQAAGQPEPWGDKVRPEKAKHLLRNKLNNLQLGLSLLNKQLAAGLKEKMQATLDKLTTEIESLCRELPAILGGGPAQAAPAPLARCK